MSQCHRRQPSHEQIFRKDLFCVSGVKTRVRKRTNKSRKENFSWKCWKRKWPTGSKSLRQAKWPFIYVHKGTAILCPGEKVFVRKGRVMTFDFVLNNPFWKHPINPPFSKTWKSSLSLCQCPVNIILDKSKLSFNSYMIFGMLYPSRMQRELHHFSKRWLRWWKKTVIYTVDDDYDDGFSLSQKVVKEIENLPDETPLGGWREEENNDRQGGMHDDCITRLFTRSASVWCQCLLLSHSPCGFFFLARMMKNHLHRLDINIA